MPGYDLPRRTSPGGVTAGAASALAPTAVQTANYTAVASDLVIADVTAGSVTVTLPSAPADKTQVGVKIVSRAQAFGVTVVPAGSDHINTATGASRTLSLTGETAILQYRASASLWYVVSSDTPVPQTDARYMYGLTIGKGGAVVPIGVRAHAAFDNPIAIASGATGGITFETFIPLLDPAATAILPVFGNWLAQNGWSNGDYDATQAIRISAAVKNSDGSIVPFSFNGSHTATLTPQTAPLAIPDAPVAFDKQVSTTDKFAATIPLTGVWLRVRVDPIDTTRQDSVTTTSASATVTDTSCVATDAGKLVSGTGIPTNTYIGAVTPGVSFTLVNAPGSSTAVNATASGTITATITATIPTNLGSYANNDTLSTQNATDLTLPGAGNVSGGASSSFYGPILVLGRTKIRKPIVTVISDSILDGYSEDFHSPYFGPVARGCLTLGYPLVKLSRGGETAGAWSTAIGKRYRLGLLEGCTHAIVSLGTNDGLLTTAGEPANETTMETRLTAIGTLLTNLGIKAWLATLPPRTTSTDAWATTGNQTPVSGSQITPLQVVNDWVRTVPAPFSGVYDLADDVMSARNSGLWTPGGTADGVHPSDTLMRGTISTSIRNLMATWSL